MSVFVYQVAYLGWTWLEKDEIKADKTGEDSEDFSGGKDTSAD